MPNADTIDVAIIKAVTAAIAEPVEIPLLHPSAMLAIAEGICASARETDDPCVCQRGGRCHARQIYRDVCVSVVLALKRAGFKLVKDT